MADLSIPISAICSSNSYVGMFYNELFVSRNSACWLLVNWKYVGRLFTLKRPEGKRILNSLTLATAKRGKRAKQFGIILLMFENLLREIILLMFENFHSGLTVSIRFLFEMRETCVVFKNKWNNYEEIYK